MSRYRLQGPGNRSNQDRGKTPPFIPTVSVYGLSDLCLTWLVE